MQCRFGWAVAGSVLLAACNGPQVSGPLNELSSRGHRASLAAPSPVPVNFRLHADAGDDATIWIEPQVVAIYWDATPIFRRQPIPGTSGPASADGSIVGRFLRDLGASAYWATAAEYFNRWGDRVGPVTYSAFWADGDETRFDRTTLAGIEAEIEWGIANGRIPYDTDSTMIYAVFAGPGVDLGGIRSGLNDRGVIPCGEHHYYETESRRFVYLVLPLNWHAGHYWPRAANCDFFPGPYSLNGDARADGAIRTLVHELAESATDPGGDVRDNGWYDDTGQEMAGFCKGTRGLVTIGGRQYFLEALLRIPELDCAL
jgi:hypothetical protein